MNDILEIIIRILISIAVLLVLARLDGSKQIAQLSYFDYIIGITVGSIAGALCIDMQIDIVHGILGIVIFMLAGIFMSWITSKSMMLRRVLTGRPILIMAEGKILYDSLKRARLDINDLLRELRSQGYFDISEINYAILETSGVMSIMPKAFAREVQIADMAIKTQEDGLLSNVIIDGKVLEYNLKAFNKDRFWLDGELKKQGFIRKKDVILATLDSNNNLSVYPKENTPTNNTVLM